MAELSRDPYPIYRRLRDEGACVWFEEAGRHVITRWKDVFELDLNPAITAQEDITLVHRAIGLSMRRLDGEELLRVRAAGMEALRAKTFTSSWLPRFGAVAGELIDTLRPCGHADLVTEFAAPFAARVAKLLIGIEGVDDQDLQGAVRAITDAIGNYQDDPQIWARCQRANRLLDDAVSGSREHTRPGTILRAMADAGLKPDAIRANAKVFAVGLLNEPRHAIPAAVWAVLRDPVQAGLVRADPALLAPAAEESLRWLSPIGMIGRQVRQDTVIGGVRLAAGTPLWVLLASANRDERRWQNPDEFDLRRASGGHVAFGHGPHGCLGAFVARRTIGTVALPAIFGRVGSPLHHRGVHEAIAQQHLAGPLKLSEGRVRLASGQRQQTAGVVNVTHGPRGVQLRW